MQLMQRSGRRQSLRAVEKEYRQNFDAGNVFWLKVNQLTKSGSVLGIVESRQRDILKIRVDNSILIPKHIYSRDFELHLDVQMEFKYRHLRLLRELMFRSRLTTQNNQPPKDAHGFINDRAMKHKNYGIMYLAITKDLHVINDKTFSELNSWAYSWE